MRATAAAIALLGLTSAAGPAHADAILSGTYTGIATEEIFVSGPTETVTNVPVSGAFSVDATGCSPSTVYPVSPPSCFTTSQNMSLSYAAPAISTAPAISDSFSAPFGLISIANPAGGQVISLTAGYTNPYSSATLTLAGAAGAFADGTDFQSLQPGAVDLAGSALSVRGGRTYSSQVTLTSVNFTQVPEPGSLSLLAGLASLGLARTRKRQLRAGT